MALPKQITIAGFGILLIFMAGTVTAEVVVVVSADSSVSTLTGTELADIYLGRRNRFPNGDPVTPIDLAEGVPSRGEFYGNYLGRSTAQIKSHWSKLIFTGRGQPPRAFENGAEAAEFVAEHPNTIGYVEKDLVTDRLRVVTIE